MSKQLRQSVVACYRFAMSNAESLCKKELIMYESTPLAGSCTELHFIVCPPKSPALLYVDSDVI